MLNANQPQPGRKAVPGFNAPEVRHRGKDIQVTDRQLRNLFEQRDRAERQLKMIDARISSARRDYSARHGLLAFPSTEAMRKAVSL